MNGPHRARSYVIKTVLSMCKAPDRAGWRKILVFFFFFFWSKTDRSKLSTETRVPFSGGGKSRARVLIEECIPHSPLAVRAPRQKIGGEMNGENEQGCVLRRRVTSSLTSRWLNAILPPMAQFGSSSRVSLTCSEKEGPFQKPRRWEDGERHPEE